MKKLLLALFAAPLALLADTSTPAGFTDNLDEAFAAAKASGKYVYACFSGSDWCGWCMRLEKEVFSDKAFLPGVTNDYVLVFIDSPRDEELVSERAREENPKLIDKYRVQGFPTAIVFDSEGEVITRTGYQRGGGKKYARLLANIRKKGPQLKRETELSDKYIKPFQEKLQGLAEETGRAAEAFIEAEKAKGRTEEDLEKEFFGPTSKFFPNFIAKVRAVIAEFETSEIPAEAEELRKEEVANARKWLDTLEKQLEKTKTAK